MYCNASSTAPTDVAEEVIFCEEISKVSFVFMKRVINPKRLCFFFQKHSTLLIFLQRMSPHQLLKYKCHPSLKVFPFNIHFTDVHCFQLHSWLLRIFICGLLFQQFLWNFSGICIISIKADTRNLFKISATYVLLSASFFQNEGKVSEPSR